MRILALEPYYGGSHKAFLDGWLAASRHEWTILSLPPYKWKWRMRHAAVTFAEQVRERLAQGQRWDCVFCSDMLNLAEFRGLSGRAVSGLPTILYFHENQLTYPVRVESERDYQFAMTNMTSALAAKAAWFNSTFHRDSFLDALEVFLKRMPDHQPTEATEAIRNKAHVFPPGVRIPPERGPREPGPVHILWAARWEHDKNPEDFFEALQVLKARDIPFRLSVIGERFRDEPAVFKCAEQEFAAHIVHWGYQETRAQYEKALLETDVFVSTAQHEFFGLSAVEAILAGAYPLLPTRLAYPEILGLGEHPDAEKFFYDGHVQSLADKLTTLAHSAAKGKPLTQASLDVRERLGRFEWPRLVTILDVAIVDVERTDVRRTHFSGR